MEPARSSQGREELKFLHVLPTTISVQSPVPRVGFGQKTQSVIIPPQGEFVCCSALQVHPRVESTLRGSSAVGSVFDGKVKYKELDEFSSLRRISQRE